MKLGKTVATVAVFLFLTAVSGVIAVAGDCDFCVCKSKDTVNSCTKCCSSAEKAGSGAQSGGAVDELKLRLSDDGKSIVDQNGEEVAKFTKGTRVQMKANGDKEVSQQMQGCWHCYRVCVIFEGSRCVEWTRTCDWDFDCK
jgi:hypothetical protein